MNKEDLIRKIVKLGLKEKEALVYLSLLKFDKLSIGKIAQETGLTKQNLYNYLDDLKIKNLVGELLDGGTRLFFAKDIDIFKESLMAEIERKKYLSKEIGEWLADYMIKTSPGLNRYRGVEEIRSAFVEIMSKQKNGASLMAIETQDLDFINFLMGKSFEVYEKFRVKNKIWINILLVVNDCVYFEAYKEAILPLRLYDETRIVNKEKAMFGFWGLYIWSDRVWLLLKENDNYEMVEIINGNLVGGFKFYFDLVWKQAVTFYKDGEIK